jgi:hypothetical protein
MKFQLITDLLNQDSNNAYNIMAVQQGYGKMAGANSLVFAYDTSDTVNSYKGEPTENTLDGGANRADGITGVFYHGNHAGADSGQYVNEYYSSKRPHVLKLKTTNATGYGMINQRMTSAAVVGATYTYSFDYKQIQYGGTFVPPLNIYGDGYKVPDSGNYYANLVTRIIDLDDGWKRFEATYDATYAGRNTFRTNMHTGDTTNFEILFDNFQIEQKSHATPFVNGTRSDTEGLKDLTGNTSIDLSNVSFNSNGEIDFDGTSDYIETSVITTDTPNITSISWVYLEDWYNPNSTIGLSVDSGTANGGFRVYNTSSNLGVWMRRSDGNGVSSISGNFRVPKKQWVQVAFVNDNGAGKIYINDHVAVSGTFTLPGNVNGPAWVSRYSGGNYYLNGKVDNVLLFNKALTEAEIISNFKRNRKRHLGADAVIDHTSDGGGWIRWWWYTGVGWPGHETEALGHPFGTFDSSSHYGFQRLPEGLDKDSVELLAKDGDGNIYKWDFASPSATAQQVWDSFTTGAQGRWHNSGDAWNPEVIAGSFFNTDQDAWQYRESEGVVSFLLDDDTCDCKSTLNAGHAMCGGGWNQTYAQPDGAYLRYGVDTLNDGGCRGPVPERTLELYYRLK